MSAPRQKIVLRIGALRVHGGTRGDAHALSEALRDSLAAHLSAHPGPLQGAPRLSLRLAPGTATQRGAALGRDIGAALAGAGTKGPKAGGS